MSHSLLLIPNSSYQDIRALFITKAQKSDFQVKIRKTSLFISPRSTKESFYFFDEENGLKILNEDGEDRKNVSNWQTIINSYLANSLRQEQKIKVEEVEIDFNFKKSRLLNTSY